MKRMQIDNTVLEYELVGTGEPVIFIHGALIADAFRPLVSLADLAARYRLVTYHRRGHAGSSPIRDTVSIKQQAADCLALMKRLGIERAHIAGHSYGGDIGLQLALDAPDTVQSLALLEPALFVGTSAEGYRTALEGAHARFRATGGETVLDEFLSGRWPEYRKPLDAALPGGFHQGARDAGAFFERELPGLLAWTFGSDEAQHVPMPTLSVIGSNNLTEGSRFAETHQFLLSSLPHAEGAIVADGWHMFHVQHPAETAASLAGFWDGHPLVDQ